MDIKNICIVGGGNVGVTLAVDISQNSSISVTLLTSKANILNDSLFMYDTDTGSKYESKNVFITDSYERAFSSADLIIVTLPSFCIEDFSNKIKNFKPAIILFIPGYGGKEFLMSEMIKKGVLIAGTDRSPYVCRLQNNNTVNASKKKSLNCSILNDSNNFELAQFITENIGIPCQKQSSYLSITLTPSNPILHTSRLYSIFKDCDLLTPLKEMIKFYADWTEEASEILWGMDKELQDVVSAISSKMTLTVTPLPAYYESDTVPQLTEKIRTIKSWHNLDSPLIFNEDKNAFFIDKDSRYFIEDFPYGLLILKSFAVISDVHTPFMNKVLKWYESLFNYRIFNTKNEIELNRFNQIPQNLGLYTINNLINFYQKE